MISKLAEIAFANVSKGEIEKTLETFFTRFRQQQFKRSCIPDGPKVGTVSLSPRGDLRMQAICRIALGIGKAGKSGVVNEWCKKVSTTS